MSASVTQTLSFGVHQGAAFDDITAIGGFPAVQNIKQIKQIRFMAGWLVDSVEITYLMNDGTTKVANHLGTAKPDVTVDFNDNELLIGVTGKTTIPGYYSNLPYLCYLQLVIMDTHTGKIRVVGPIGNGAGDAKYTGKTFAVAGPIIAFAGQLHSGGDPANALTLSFIKSEKLAVGKDVN
ncbi:hypothetical protein CALCODRAFT_517454 [Calocera cornea HHB12733]|uniref:Jacalin-type lectin domain-containing protein n=1 Tax=Calocera cornea HHB12733 TaxID=1353952 RepID=A0A165G1U0_9BASI|nr:hypothetical protein CALCODRAFT_517454 [Calocera cornea HHB12733]